MRLVRQVLLMLSLALLPLAGFALPANMTEAHTCCASEAAGCQDTQAKAHPLPATDAHCCPVINGAVPTGVGAALPGTHYSQVHNPHLEPAAITCSHAPPHKPPRSV
ncbi:hypothetical protein [Crenobacter caeni]|uniref:Secreted protein n=1 Tax=Crenobacter caeni TaxID=2705474 RepID=A0A6B2KTZ0_9NEIS|nr:hypothetical protein [Crenobacter caeni]NDV13493.1 hypothetical protein [Crenobacter caeni]